MLNTFNSQVRMRTVEPHACHSTADHAGDNNQQANSTDVLVFVLPFNLGGSCYTIFPPLPIPDSIGARLD
jgi:hypothetical protein